MIMSLGAHGATSLCWFTDSLIPFALARPRRALPRWPAARCKAPQHAAHLGGHGHDLPRRRHSGSHRQVGLSTLVEMKF